MTVPAPDSTRRGATGVQYADWPGAPVHIAPSILNADFGRLRDQILAVVDAGVDWIHLDVMDGHFVPNISFGPHVAKVVNEVTDVPLDVHLMISNPGKFIPAFVEAGADSISVHCELVPDEVWAALDLIRDAGCGAGLVLNPDTPTPQSVPYLSHVNLVLLMSVFPGFGGQRFISATIPRIREMVALRQSTESRFAIEVDGGVDESNISALVAAGAGMLVIGTRIFRSPDIAASVRTLRNLTCVA